MSSKERELVNSLTILPALHLNFYLMAAQESPPKNFDDIPEEVKLKIFSYFTPKELCKFLAPVSKTWWTICKDPSLWKRLQIDIRPETPADVYRQLIASCGTSLTSLTLQIPNSENNFQEYFSNFILHYLTELDIVGWRSLNNNDTLNIVSCSPNVEILSIHVISSIEGLRNISSLQNLKSLTVAGHLSRSISRTDLEHIVKKCKKIEALQLELLDSFDDEFFFILAEYRRETLKHLLISRESLTHNGIRALASCQNLSSLRLTGNRCPLTEEVLSALSRIPNLEWLDLGGNMDMDPQTWNNFFNCPNLSCLKILVMYGTDMDDNAVVSVATTCKKLVILDLARNYDLHDAGVQVVIDNCSELFFLDISATQVTSDILSSVPKKLPKLKYLNLQICRGIDESAMERFTRMNPRVHIIRSFEEIYVDYTVDKSLNLNWRFSFGRFQNLVECM